MPVPQGCVALNNANNVLIDISDRCRLAIQGVVEDVAIAEEDEAMIEQLKENIVDLAKLQNGLKAKKQAFGKLDVLPPNTELTDAYNKEIAKASYELDQEDIQDHQFVKEMNEKLWSIQKPGQPMPQRDLGDEDDLIMTQQSISYNCPISTRLLVDPVKHTTCGHVFSRQEINDLIHQNERHRNRTKCPVSGCGSYIDKRNLAIDNYMAHELKRRNRYTQETNDDEREILDV